MEVSQLAEQVNQVVDSLLSGGSRYRVEKIAIIVVYAVISVASLVWAFSGGGPKSVLNAHFEAGRLDDIDDQNLHLTNDGGAWSTVRVVLNRVYLWTAPQMEADSQVTLRPADFNYYYYIPRAWGREDWERLSQKEKPGPTAPDTLHVEHVRVWAREGSQDFHLGLDGKPVDPEERKAARDAAKTGADDGADAEK